MFLPARYEFQFPHSLNNTYDWSFWIIAILVGIKWVSHSFDLYFPNE